MSCSRFNIFIIHWLFLWSRFGWAKYSKIGGLSLFLSDRLTLPSPFFILVTFFSHFLSFGPQFIKYVQLYCHILHACAFSFHTVFFSIVSCRLFHVEGREKPRLAFEPCNFHNLYVMKSSKKIKFK